MFLLRNEKISYPDIAVISGIEVLMESQNRILMVNFCLDQADLDWLQSLKQYFIKSHIIYL